MPPPRSRATAAGPPARTQLKGGGKIRMQAIGSGASPNRTNPGRTLPKTEKRSNRGPILTPKRPSSRELVGYVGREQIQLPLEGEERCRAEAETAAESEVGGLELREIVHRELARDLEPPVICGLSSCGRCQYQGECKNLENRHGRHSRHDGDADARSPSSCSTARRRRRQS